MRMILLGVFLLASGCMSAYVESTGANLNRSFSKIYISDFGTTWMAVTEAMKRYEFSIFNKEKGVLITKWTDNTAERNQKDSFGSTRAYVNAKYRFELRTSPGFFKGKPSVKVTIRKEQLVKDDILEEWRPLKTDGIEENTLLYRLGRLIYVHAKAAQIEEAKVEAELKNIEF